MTPATLASAVVMATGAMAVVAACREVRANAQPREKVSRGRLFGLVLVGTAVFAGGLAGLLAGEGVLG